MPKLEVDAKVNILALTSFILSLLAIGNQFASYVYGARVQLHAPQSVILRAIKFPSSGENMYLNLETPVTFTNLGAIGYNGIVTHQVLEIKIDNHRKKLNSYWHFLDVDDRNTSLNREPEYRGTEPAGPKVVPAQGAITHYTRFISKATACKQDQSSRCDPAENIINLDEGTLKKLSELDRLEVKVSADIIGGKSQSVGCWINGKNIDVKQLTTVGWAVVDCYPM